MFDSNTDDDGNTKVRVNPQGKKCDFTTIYLKYSTKRLLLKLVINRESYEDVILRLIDRRDWDVVNNQLITKEMMK